MKHIAIFKAKPNPIGKDKNESTQLAGEWVDIINDGDEAISLQNVELQHIAYSPLYPNGVWSRVRLLSDVASLNPGQVLRVHSGGSISEIFIHPIDKIGADIHRFSGLGYVWNNNKSDSPRLVFINGGSEIDKAMYVAFPIEGKILKRVGNLLV